MVATYLVGPAFGWQHVQLGAGEGQAINVPALGQEAPHPADEARWRGILALLAQLGSAEGARVQALWHRSLIVHGEIRPTDDEGCYPQSLLDSLAAHAGQGGRAVGLRGFQEAADPTHPGPNRRTLIQDARERFLRDADSSAGWKGSRLREAWSDFGVSQP